MRTILASDIGVAGFGEQVKPGDRAEALLGALDDVVQLGVDKVGDGVARTLQAAHSHTQFAQHPKISWGAVPILSVCDKTRLAVGSIVSVDQKSRGNNEGEFGSLSDKGQAYYGS